MPAHASVTGNKLAEQCAEDASIFLDGACSGNTVGVANMLDNNHFNEYDKSCIPSGTTFGQYRKITVAYLDV